MATATAAKEAGMGGSAERKNRRPRNRTTSSLANQNKSYLTPWSLSPDVEITRISLRLFCLSHFLSFHASHKVAALDFYCFVLSLCFLRSGEGCVILLFSPPEVCVGREASKESHYRASCVL